MSATDQLRQQASTVKDNLRELGRLTVDAAQEKLGDARQTAADVLARGREKAGTLEHQLEDRIRQQPLQSVLIAAGAGVLLGYLLRRR